ncbi:hypothetical protein [Mycoplasma sp. 1654_15]|uniref:hypothetical protein n=1 Tax=Mycoplasma sp. 1654_15 TaxID=2725994 RepID=UPI001449224F|nr:hypothetical protein [Mycoplasma sp. 1654_15]QJB71261.1 hypothetical protein HF996_02080 [Mycoplasma sp. 1654_15]
MKIKKLLLPLALMPTMAMIPIVALSCSKTEAQPPKQIQPTRANKEQVDELKTVLTEENKKITDTVLPIVNKIQLAKNAGQIGFVKLAKFDGYIKQLKKENEELIKELKDDLTEVKFNEIKRSQATKAEKTRTQFESLLALYNEGIIEKTPDFEFQKDELFKVAEEYIANKPTTENTTTQGTPTQGKSTTNEGSTTNNKPKTKTIKEQADELKTALTEENKKITDTVLPIVKTIQPTQTAGQIQLNRLMDVYSGIEKHQKENKKLIQRLEKDLTEDDFRKVKYSLAEMSKTIAKQFQNLLSLYKEGIIEKTPDFEFQKDELFKVAEDYIAKETPMEATKETPMEATKETSMETPKETPMKKKTPTETPKETPMMKETSMNNNTSMKEKTPMEAPKETPMEQR